MGGGGSSSKQYESRVPESPELLAMQNALYSQFTPQIGQYGSDKSKADSNAEKYRQNYENAYSGLQNVTENGISEGLSDAYNSYLTRSMNKSLGEAMAKNAGNGVLNSSVTNRAINEIGTNTADAFGKNYATLLGQQSSNYNALMNSAQSAKSQEWMDLNSQYSGLMDFFKTMRQSADTNTYDTVVEQGGK